MKEKAYDTILMDIQMPEMDGLKATAHIRNSQGRPLYIVAMSEDRDICLQSGMNDYRKAYETGRADECIKEGRRTYRINIAQNFFKTTRLLFG
jgi:CheY-like chemotaxis protein